MPITSLPGANPRLPEHKIGVFVLFWPSGPPFSGFSSTKSGFLCAFGVCNPCFLAFRAQNRGFCAFLAFEPSVFGLFEHKIEVFVLFWPSEPPFSGVSSTKLGFLCAFGFRNLSFRAFRVQNRGFCAREADVRHRESAILNFCGHRAKSSASGSAQLCCM